MGGRRSGNPREESCLECGKIFLPRVSDWRAYRRCCRLCQGRKNYESNKKWKKENAKKYKEHLYAWLARNKEKHLAHRCIQNAVKRGTLVKPTCCSVCGANVGKSRIHGHHRDYKKRRDVIWVCCPCHMDIHRKEKEGQS